MFKNYFKITFRNIIKNKGNSFINVVGLAVGMACCILITLWVIDELSFDKFHKNAEHIYRVGHNLSIGGMTRVGPQSSAPIAPALIKDFPEVINAVRIAPTPRTSIQYADKQYYEEAIFYADSSIFDVFTFPMIAGNPKTALVTPYSVVLTETTANKYFGKEDPLGKTLRFDGDKIYTVTGIVQDVPTNSHFSFDLLGSYGTLISENPQEMSMWGRIGGTYTYILLDEKSDPLTFAPKLQGFIDNYMGNALKARGASISLFIQPLTSIHLHSNYEGEISGNGDIKYIYLFSGIAVFILLIACVNFINLATARAVSRAKEVGMRKTFGAARMKLVRQFLGESTFYCFISIFLSFLFLELFLPLFNNITGRELNVNLWSTFWFIPGLFGLILLVGLVAGSYPAFILSSFQPIKVLKGNLKSGTTNTRIRRLLVVFQFTISVALIIGTLIINNQLNYIRNKNLGFHKEQVLVIPNINSIGQLSVSSAEEQFASITGVLNVAAATTVPGGSVMIMNFLPEGFTEEESQLMGFMYIDDKLLSTLGIELVTGRNFSTAFTTDSAEAVIINETAARRFGWTDPIGKTIRQTIPSPTGPIFINKKVIGVVKDFHISSLHEPIQPLFIGYKSNDLNLLAVRLTSDNIINTVDLIKDKWNQLSSNQPFDYYFLDESFGRLYRAETRLGNLTLSFTLLAVFIGCLGLFSLSSYTAQQRTKEIGIRKVLGASVVNITRLLLREFTLLVLFANVFAWPLAYFIMKHWLEGFAYHIDIGIGIFLLTAMIAMVIAVMTVGYQAIKTAILNPVEALRHE